MDKNNRQNSGTETGGDPVRAMRAQLSATYESRPNTASSEVTSVTVSREGSPPADEPMQQPELADPSAHPAADTPDPSRYPVAGFSENKNPHQTDRGPGARKTGAAMPYAPAIHPAVMISSLVINLLALALPLVILQVYDRILPNKATDTLLLLMLGLGAVLVIDTIMKIARAHMVSWAAAQSNHRAGIDAVARILHTPSAALEHDAPGVIIDRLNALDAMRDYYGGQSRLLLIDLPFVVIFLGLIAFVGGALVAVPIVLFIVLALLTMTSGRRLRQVLEARAANDDKKYDFIVETLLGIQTIKGLAMEPLIQRRFERLQKETAEATYQTVILGNTAQSYGNLFANLTMISVVTVGAMMVIAGSITVGTLACCTLLAGRSIQPILRGLGLWTQMQSLAISRSRVGKLFTLPPAPLETPAANGAYQGAVEIRDLSFTHEGADQPIFADLDLTVKPGEIISLTGDDNAGKSTLLRLISGELTPSSGRVLIDGSAVKSTGSAHPATAYISQQTTIFQGTILENLTMFRAGGAIDAAREAARLIGLENDIHRLPEGYDTALGQSISDELPAGMMQRIVIARALALKPKIILFDEANMSLDGASDTLLRDGLCRLHGSVTIFLVSHRPSLLKIADRNFDLHDLTLHETGRSGSSQPHADTDLAKPVSGTAIAS